MLKKLPLGEQLSDIGPYWKPGDDETLGRFLWYTTTKPLTGIAYLQSLPVGTRILSPIGRNKAIIVPSGVYLPYDHGFLPWDELCGNWALANSKTCPEWHPEESNDDKAE